MTQIFTTASQGVLKTNLVKSMIMKDDNALEGLFIAAEHILGVANEQVPFEEGDLAASGGVSQDESTTQTAISYNTDYAVRQHEDMTMKHDSGRNAKFLENAVNSERATASRIIANTIKNGMNL
jgi:hypothetical protein